MISTKIRFLLLSSSLMGLGLGCTGVPLRPDGLPGPQKCPSEALEAMEAWGIAPGDTASIVINTNKYAQAPVTLSDGPVEGYLVHALGALPAWTLLYGHIWAGNGSAIVIRYYEIRFRQGGRYPFCGVVLNRDGDLNRRPGSPPGVGIIKDNSGILQAVTAFH